MTEHITRDGYEYTVIEELADETLGALDQEPQWLYMPEGWQIDGDTATANLATFNEDGSKGTETFRLTLKIERTETDE